MNSVIRFIREPAQLKIWSRDYFLQLSAIVRYACVDAD